jgi:hypothetical protein
VRDGHISHAICWRQLLPNWEYVIPCLETKHSLTGNCSRLAKEKLVFLRDATGLVLNSPQTQAMYSSEEPITEQWVRALAEDLLKDGREVYCRQPINKN